MPITQERQTIQDMRAAGFSEEQALLLAAKFEATAQAAAQDLKTFIGTENERLRAEIDVRFSQIEARLSDMEARFERSLRIVLVSLISAFVGVTTLAVAIIKLFPNAH